MKLCCLFIVFLIMPISTTYIYSMNSDFSSPSNLGQIEFDLQALEPVIPAGRSRSKRSQRNANILYRYCRLSGKARHFCLKYAIRMILATGH